MKSTGTIVVDAARQELVEEYKRLGGKRYSPRWKDDTLLAKVLESQEAQAAQASPAEPEPPAEPLPESPAVVALRETVEETAVQLIEAGHEPTPNQREAVEAVVGPLPAAAGVERNVPLEQVEDVDALEYLVQHRLHRSIKQGDRSPGCFALAALPAEILSAGRLVYAEDAGMRWLSLGWLPRGRLRGTSHDTWHLTLRKAVVRYGVPEIGHASPLGDDGVIARWDLGGPVKEKDGQLSVGGLSLDDRRIFRTAVDMTWAALSTGMKTRKFWSGPAEGFLGFVADTEGEPFRIRQRFASWKAGFVKEHGREPSVAEQRSRLWLFGGDEPSTERAIRQRDWMPAPLLAFTADKRDLLWDLSTLQILDDGQAGRIAPPRMFDRFAVDVAAAGTIPVDSPCHGIVVGVSHGRSEGHPCTWIDIRGSRLVRLRASRQFDSEVEAGDRVEVGQRLGADRAFECGKEFAAMSEDGRWKTMQLRLKDGLPMFLRDWFDRQLLEVEPGFVHADALVVSQAARLSVPEKLLWDLSPAASFYSMETDSFVLPAFLETALFSGKATVQTNRADLRIDVTPVNDPRWLDKPTRWHEERASDRRHAAKTAEQVARQKKEAARDYAEFLLEQAAAIKAAEQASKLAREESYWRQKLDAELTRTLQRPDVQAQLARYQAAQSGSAA